LKIISFEPTLFRFGPFFEHHDFQSRSWVIHFAKLWCKSIDLLLLFAFLSYWGEHVLMRIRVSLILSFPAFAWWRDVVILNLLHFAHSYRYLSNFIINKNFDNKHLISEDYPLIHIFQSNFIKILIESLHVKKYDLQFLWKVLMTISGRQINEFVIIIYLESNPKSIVR